MAGLCPVPRAVVHLPPPPGKMKNGMTKMSWLVFFFQHWMARDSLGHGTERPVINPSSRRLRWLLVSSKTPKLEWKWSCSQESEESNKNRLGINLTNPNPRSAPSESSARSMTAWEVQWIVDCDGRQMNNSKMQMRVCLN